MAGNVSEYAATNARVRSMLSTLLTPADWERLNEAPDFDILITLLKRTVYGPFLDRIKEDDLNPRQAAFQVRAHLAESYANLIYTTPIDTRPLLVQLFRGFEVDNLKAVLRGIQAGASWNKVRYLLFPSGPLTVLPAETMVESGSIASAVELLRGTPYYETLSHAMRRYSTEGTLFPLEVALDLNYWRDLWSDVNQIRGQSRTQVMRLIGPLLDTTNLMWAIRYRVYHHLSEEELINYTLPFGYHIQDEDIRAIAAGADIARIVERIFPELSGVEDLLSNPQQGLSILEVQLQREVLRRCRAALLGDPFHIGVPVAYLLLLEIEVQDVTVLIEAKSMPEAEIDFRNYLISEHERTGA